VAQFILTSVNFIKILLKYLEKIRANNGPYRIARYVQTRNSLSRKPEQFCVYIRPAAESQMLKTAKAIEKNSRPIV
jgi:hypothetical protein